VPVWCLLDPLAGRVAPALRRELSWSAGEIGHLCGNEFAQFSGDDVDAGRRVAVTAACPCSWRLSPVRSACSTFCSSVVFVGPCPIRSTSPELRNLAGIDSKNQ